jgi:glycosyltransferase involved in cell wall biosynthesis
MRPDRRPHVTVIIPCRNEERYIGPCLESILACDYPRDRLEVLVVDGMSDDGSREIVARYAARHGWIRLLDNPKRTAPVALNLAIKAAAGSVLVRMDAHATYPPHYVTRLVAALEEHGADNVGGVLRTLPGATGPMAEAIAIGLSHPLGVGSSRFRIGTSRPRWVDTVAFFCVRRELFDRVGMFDEELSRDQDGEFNGRVVKHGGRILLVPDVELEYYARPTLRQTSRMFYQYGYYKPLVARKLGRVMTLRQLVPPLFVAGLVLSGLAALIRPAAAPGVALVAGSYLLVVGLAAIHAALKKGPLVGLSLAAVLPVMHVTYGVGYWHRILEFLLPGRGDAPQPVAEPPLTR